MTSQLSSTTVKEDGDAIKLNKTIITTGNFQFKHNFYASDIDETLLQKVLTKFRNELYKLDKNVIQINQTVITSKLWQDYLFTVVSMYYRHIEQRLNNSQVNYLELILFNEYPYDDFLLFGDRFLEYVRVAEFYPPIILEKLFQLYSNYKKLFPPEILGLRASLLQTKFNITKLQKEKSNSQKKTLNELIDYKSITFKKINKRFVSFFVGSERGFLEENYISGILKCYSENTL